MYVPEYIEPIASKDILFSKILTCTAKPPSLQVKCTLCARGHSEHLDISWNSVPPPLVLGSAVSDNRSGQAIPSSVHTDLHDDQGASWGQKKNLFYCRGIDTNTSAGMGAGEGSGRGESQGKAGNRRTAGTR